MTDSSSTDLKPCPFCGGAADIAMNDDGFHFIYCDECGTSSAPRAPWSNQDLIDDWNTRPEADALNIAHDALSGIARGYALGHISHVDYRSGAARMANEALTAMVEKCPALAGPQMSLQFLGWSSQQEDGEPGA